MTIGIEFLKKMFGVACAAGDARLCLPPHLPLLPETGKIVVVGAGKAAAAMAQAVEGFYDLDRIEGVVVTRYGYDLPTKKIKVMTAAHPVPDTEGERAALAVLRCVSGLSPQDTVIALISGGGSALLSLPSSCLAADQKRAVNKQLLQSGATIHEINCLRKHLSGIKGGRLAKAAWPATVLTYVISDVPGDDLATVASGPTLADLTTQEQAIAVIRKYGIDVPQSVLQWLSDPVNETPKILKNARPPVMAACAKDALHAAAAFAEKNGVRAVVWGDDIEGEARQVAQEHVRSALADQSSRPCIFLSGGETTVVVRGSGRGGRNGEYMLAALAESSGSAGFYGLAADTDGIDGSEDNAGAFFTPQSVAAAQAKGLDITSYLDNNDSYGFFSKIDGLVKTGPTFTNVNDFRALLRL